MAYRQCQIKLLKQEISNQKRNLIILRRDLTSVRNELSLKLSFIDLNHVCNLFLIGNDKAILKHQQIQNKKLNNLRVTTLENPSHDPDKVVYNFSDCKTLNLLFHLTSLNMPFHLTSLNMPILCCCLSFCFVILRTAIYLFLKLKLLNQKF